MQTHPYNATLLHNQIAVASMIIDALSNPETSGQIVAAGNTYHSPTSIGYPIDL